MFSHNLNNTNFIQYEDVKMGVSAEIASFHSFKKMKF